MSDTKYIAGLEGRLREVVVRCYVDGLQGTYGVFFPLPLLFIQSFCRCILTCQLSRWSAQF